MPETTLVLKAQNDDLRAKLAASEAAVASLREEIEKLKSAGQGSDELEKNLEGLQDEAYNAERALEANNAELAKAKQAQLDAAKATRENTTEQEGLFGALSRGQKILGGAVASILAFRESYTRTRQVIKFFKDQFGLDIDEMVSKSAGLEKIAERIVGLGDASRRAGQESENLRNMTNVLDNLGIQHAGTIEDVTKKYDEWVASHRKVVEATEATNQEFEKFQKTVAGFSLDELKQELIDLTEIGAKLASEGKLDEGPFAEAFKERINKATTALELLGTKGLSPELLNKFQQFAERGKLATESTEALAKAQQQLAKDAASVVSELEKQTASLEKTTRAIDDMASESKASLDELIGKFSALSDAQNPQKVAEIKDEIIQLTDEYDSLGTELVSVGDEEERREEINRRLAQLTQELARIEDAAAQERIEAQQEFSRLLSQYEGQIRSLPEEVRPALESIIRQFRFQNEQVGINEDGIRKFKGAWVENLIIAGRTVDGFADQTAAAMAKAQTSAEATAAAIGVSWDDASTHADGYLAKLDQIIAKHQAVAAGVPSIADAAEESF